MAIHASTIRPGLLVSLKTTIKGNSTYTKETIEAAHIAVDGAEVEEWKTKRIVADPFEFDRAKKTRAQAGNRIRGACANSAFGLLCREDRVDQLEIAIREARDLCDAFNAEARVTRIAVYVIAGKVASDDAEAIRAVRSEIADMMGEIKGAVESIKSGMTADQVKAAVEKIRETANKMRNVSQILTPGAAEIVQDAIDAARKVARQVTKAEDLAAIEVNKDCVSLLAQAAQSFVDIEAPVAVASAPIEHQGAAVEFDPDKAPAGWETAGGETEAPDDDAIAAAAFEALERRPMPVAEEPEIEI